MRTTPFLDDAGRLAGEVSVTRDLTELLRTEQALTATRRDLETKLAEIQKSNEHLQATVNDLNWYNSESRLLSEMAELLQACVTHAEACDQITLLAKEVLPRLQKQAARVPA